MQGLSSCCAPAPQTEPLGLLPCPQTRQALLQLMPASGISQWSSPLPPSHPPEIPCTFHTDPWSHPTEPRQCCSLHLPLFSPYNSKEILMSLQSGAARLGEAQCHHSVIIDAPRSTRSSWEPGGIQHPQPLMWGWNSLGAISTSHLLLPEPSHLLTGLCPHHHPIF